jgi:hypothetical protein
MQMVSWLGTAVIENKSLILKMPCGSSLYLVKIQNESKSQTKASRLLKSLKIDRHCSTGTTQRVLLLGNLVGQQN